MAKKPAVTFKRDRSIWREGIRVGWIEDRGNDASHGRWRVRFTPASNMPGVFGTYRSLTIARTNSIIALSRGAP